MTVWELMQELMKYPPDAPVSFHAKVDWELCLDDYNIAVPEDMSKWIDCHFDDELQIKQVETEKNYCYDQYGKGYIEKNCPVIELMY